ncbi:hypothetical protein BKA69DRAFT_1129520 [Paraphysoderma sedebokerense]|nr:hypothetical protein BKA69DRAFT_1129520 [Paraphysoderma sedebokerense]
MELEEPFAGSSKKFDLTYLREVSVGFLRGVEVFSPSSSHRSNSRYNIVYSASPTATAAIFSQVLQLSNSLPSSTSVPVAHSSHPTFSNQALSESNLSSVPNADSIHTAEQQWKDGIWSEIKTKTEKLEYRESTKIHIPNARNYSTRRITGALLLATEKESDKYKVDGVFSID